MASEGGVGPTTFFPLRAREDLFLFAKMLQDIMLLTLFIGLQAVRFVDSAVTFVMRHGAVNALFRGYTF